MHGEGVQQGVLQVHVGEPVPCYLQVTSLQSREVASTWPCPPRGPAPSAPGGVPRHPTTRADLVTGVGAQVRCRDGSGPSGVPAGGSRSPK